MIVQPDFLEHFKTKALVKLTRWEAAPLAVLRLWGHCQNSRRWQFPTMTPEQLGALCAWGEHKPRCHVALIKAGFLKALPGGGFEAHQWDEQNGKLIANWANGPKGGRPKKGEKGNPSETHGLATGNPPETDKIRSDKIRVEKNVPKSKSVGVGEIQEGGAHGARREDREERLEGGVSGAQDVQVPGAELDAGVMTVPEFEPLPAGAFQRELEGMLKEARKARAKVEASGAACVWVDKEREGYAEDVVWYENALEDNAIDDARREKLKRELAQLTVTRLVRVRGPLKAQAVAVLGAWSKRIEELEKAIAGVKR